MSLSGLPIFGGCDDKSAAQTDLPEDAPLLNATTVFGGVGVANEPH